MPTAPVDDELMDRFEAYRDASDDALPSTWTPEHVQTRLIEAFDVLVHSEGRVGPSQKSGFWPAICYEVDDIRDQQPEPSKRRRATSDQISRMNEALAWPMVWLEHEPFGVMQGDALTLWCLCQATEREVEPVLHRRKRAAMTIAERMTRDINASEAQAGARETRRQIAKEVAAWVNARLERATSPAEQNAIRSEARLRLAAACKERRCLPVRVQPHEAVPGLCMNRVALHKWRKRGAATIAAALIKARVAVR